jgi:hypothetical protein
MVTRVMPRLLPLELPAKCAERMLACLAQEEVNSLLIASSACSKLRRWQYSRACST